jgi:hypothetical protein
MLVNMGSKLKKRLLNNFIGRSVNNLCVLQKKSGVKYAVFCNIHSTNKNKYERTRSFEGTKKPILLLI